ncbi:2Fe-2S iron-sulfur cluster-binding protein [Micromonospora sp. NPDC005113]
MHEVRLSIYRGSHEAPAPRLDVRIPVPPRSTLLDALIQLRDDEGVGFAFDYACETNNSCKLCYVRVNGVPAYACTFLLEHGGNYTVDPIDRARPHQDLFLRRESVW